MADRTISPESDSFLVWTAIIASLIVQFLLTLLGLGVGIVSIGYAPAEGQTIAWAGLLWRAASGIFAAAVAGAVIGGLGEGIDDARKTVLARLAWAASVLIVGFVAALLANSGAAIAPTVGGPLMGMLDAFAEGKLTEPMRQTAATVAVSSVIALLLGAAAAVACAIYAPESAVRTTRPKSSPLARNGYVACGLLSV